MDVATFETAVKLKEAGFPQPDPEAGQVWWIIEGREQARTVYGETIIGRIEMYNRSPVKGAYSIDFIYAPTATDILPKLEHPDPTVDFFLFWSDGLFSVIKAYWMDASGNIAEHANAAEALALAWLELKKEQAQ